MSFAFHSFLPFAADSLSHRRCWTKKEAPLNEDEKIKRPTVNLANTTLQLSTLHPSYSNLLSDDDKRSASFCHLYKAILGRELGSPSFQMKLSDLAAIVSQPREKVLALALTRRWDLHHRKTKPRSARPPAPPRLEVSHRCHNRRCFNPDHVVIETKGTNWGRERCVEQSRCDCTISCILPLSAAELRAETRRLKAQKVVERPVAVKAEEVVKVEGAASPDEESDWGEESEWDEASEWESESESESESDEGEDEGKVKTEVAKEVAKEIEATLSSSDGDDEWESEDGRESEEEEGEETPPTSPEPEPKGGDSDAPDGDLSIEIVVRLPKEPSAATREEEERAERSSSPSPEPEEVEADFDVGDSSIEFVDASIEFLEPPIPAKVVEGKVEEDEEEASSGEGALPESEGEALEVVEPEGGEVGGETLVGAEGEVGEEAEKVEVEGEEKEGDAPVGDDCGKVEVFEGEGAEEEVEALVGGESEVVAVVEVGVAKEGGEASSEVQTAKETVEVVQGGSKAEEVVVQKGRKGRKSLLRRLLFW